MIVTHLMLELVLLLLLELRLLVVLKYFIISITESLFLRLQGHFKEACGKLVALKATQTKGVKVSVVLLVRFCSCI